MGDHVESEDIYDGLGDTPKHKSKQVLKKSVKSKNKIQHPPRSPSLSEAALREKEVELIRDLIAVEENEKATVKELQNENEKLKKEIKRFEELRASDAANITELRSENENLKKNICSLFKTAKSEIEYKDSLLSEANQRLDNFNLNYHRFESENYERCSNCSKNPFHSGQRTTSEPDGRGLKRKDFDDGSISKLSDAQPESKKKAVNEGIDIVAQSSSTKLASIDKSSSDCTTGKPKPKTATHVSSTPKKSKGTVSKQEKCSKLVQTEEIGSFFSAAEPNTREAANAATNTLGRPVSLADVTDYCSMSRDTTETNNVFFSLLPGHLKQAFSDYEQSQIISLNRLKQSFVSQHFNSDMNASSSIFKCDPSLVTASFSQILFNKEGLDAPSVNTSSLLTPSTVHEDVSDRHRSSKTPSSKVSSRTYDRSSSRTRLSSRPRSGLSWHSYHRDRRSYFSRRNYGYDKRSTVSKRIL